MMFVDSAPFRWATLAVLNIPLYLGLGFLIFGSWPDFRDCLRFWLTPDWLSFFRGEYWADRWSELKIFLFAVLCLLALYGEFRFFFGDPFRPGRRAGAEAFLSLPRDPE